MFKKAFNRESNFELLRIICMLGIICSHFVVLHMDSSKFSIETYYCANLFAPLGKIAFVTFVALSCWFLIGNSFKTKRFLALYLELFFYNLVFSVIGILITKQRLDVTTWISLFIPISGTRNGFMTIFLLFYLFTPFLSIIDKKINKKQSIFLIIILFWTQVLAYIISVIFSASWFASHVPSTLILFVFIYFLVSFMKKNVTFTKTIKLIAGLTLLTSYTFIYLFRVNAFNIAPNTFIYKFVNSLYGMEYNLLNVIGGVSLFILFNFKMKTNKIINVISMPVLGILLAHDNILFKSWFFKNAIRASDYCKTGGYVILIIIGFSILIYIFFGIIDFLRKFLLEENIFKLNFINKISNKFDNIINVKE